MSSSANAISTQKREEPPHEIHRCKERESGQVAWDLWGTYLSDRQWGTVREDYSADGNAWESFPFDQSHLRTYRWGEDGLLGLSDMQGILCFSPVLWNGKDSILKERLFGLGNPEGNHGEDIKDTMYHLAGTPKLFIATPKTRFLINSYAMRTIAGQGRSMNLN
jgi:hypothetical protein